MYVKFILDIHSPIKATKADKSVKKHPLAFLIFSTVNFKDTINNCNPKLTIE